MCFHVPPESGRSLFSNGLAVTESLGSTVITTYIPYTSDVLSIWHVYIVPYYSRERILQGVHIYIYIEISYISTIVSSHRLKRGPCRSPFVEVNCRSASLCAGSLQRTVIDRSGWGCRCCVETCSVECFMVHICSHVSKIVGKKP